MFEKILSRLFPANHKVEDFEHGVFPAAEGVSGSITPLANGSLPRFGGPAVILCSGNYVLHFSGPEGQVRKLITEEARQKILADLRRQELEVGRVYRLPDLSTLTDHG